jgi:uncharacterized protein YegP (UPF0339 family)
MKFIIKRTRNKEFYFTLVATNNKVIATGETYKRKGSLLNTIKKINPFVPVKDETQ